MFPEKIKFLFAVLPVFLGGCTALSLEGHAVNHALTSTDIRYQMVLDNLAKMIANNGNLPSMATVTDGVTNLGDSANFDARTALDGLKGFTQESLGGGASRNPDYGWTMDPAHTFYQLRALQDAYLWVVTGRLSTDEIDVLNLFQVYCDLICLPRGWYCAGGRADVPKNACHVGHYCDTYVWVAPGQMKELSDFTLILADIATVDPSTLVLTAKIVLHDAAPISTAAPIAPPAMPPMPEPGPMPGEGSTNCGPCFDQLAKLIKPTPASTAGGYEKITLPAARINFDKGTNAVTILDPIVLYEFPPNATAYWTNLDCSNAPVFDSNDGTPEGMRNQQPKRLLQPQMLHLGQPAAQAIR